MLPYKLSTLSVLCRVYIKRAARLGIRPVLVLSKEQKGVSSFTEIEKLAELVGIVKG